MSVKFGPKCVLRPNFVALGNSRDPAQTAPGLTLCTDI